MRSLRLRWGPVVVAAVLAASTAGGCSSPQAAVTSGAPTTPTTAAVASDSTTAVAHATTTAPPATTDASSSTPPTTTAPVARPSGFSATSSAVTAADLGASWRPGCPVGPEDLRLLRLTHWGFDGQPRMGALVVHRDVADAVVAVFRQLYDERFPIRRMEPIDAYGGDDPASMAADNTSAFNCRNAVASGPRRWSVHAFGKAIDVNPVENPYLEGGVVQPPAGAAFVDRSEYRPGMAVDGGQLTAAFAAVGWFWGGSWAGTPDYQHFSATGG